MKVKIKKTHPNAIIPQYAKEGDAGLDLTAVSMETDHCYDGGVDTVTYGTGLAFEIPQGCVGLLFPRSSIAKTQITLANSVGVIDSGYRGEVKLKFKKYGYKDYNIGDRVGQLVIMPYPKIELEEVDELSYTDRDDGGFGSTGK
jgi:dUTP pyrophosphatase